MESTTVKSLNRWTKCSSYLFTLKVGRQHHTHRNALNVAGKRSKQLGRGLALHLSFLSSRALARWCTVHASTRRRLLAGGMALMADGTGSHAARWKVDVEPGGTKDSSSPEQLEISSQVLNRAREMTDADGGAQTFIHRNFMNSSKWVKTEFHTPDFSE